ncbi:MAG: LysR family transcriptional regulator [Solobacterium sp.]|nr:LysR family transcriptional regulator [Solobacterium sp.]
MNYEQIETFLTIAALKNITAAANYMYLSQSTVSNRIQALEEELDAQLFIRRKGMRNVELTSYGNAFIPIAEQWSSLYKDTQALKHQDNISTLNIAAVDAVNACTYTGLYEMIIKKHPQLKLNIRTHHSNEIHGLVENRTADIGFTFSRINYPNIISKPVFRELMYLVCHKDNEYHDEISCSELSTDNEIYLNWGPDYDQWHLQHWPEDKYPLITVNTGNLLQNFLHEKDRWAIAPMSVIQAIKGRDITYYRIKESPPPRICYELTSRYPNFSHVQAISLFEKELENYIRDNNSICTFEDWMLQNR